MARGSPSVGQRHDLLAASATSIWNRRTEGQGLVGLDGRAENCAYAAQPSPSGKMNDAEAGSVGLTMMMMMIMGRLIHFFLLEVGREQGMMAWSR